MEPQMSWGADDRLHTRDWALGTGLTPPLQNNWLHDLGLAIIFLCPSLALLIVGLRIWGRWSARQLGIDDAFIVSAMCISIAWTGALLMYEKTNYLGIHAWDIPEHDVQRGLVWDWLIQVLYHPILALVKSSVLFFHLKLCGTKKSVRWSAYVLNTINLMGMVAILFTTAFQCVPVRSYWDKSVPSRCIDNMTFNFFYNGLVIATDIAVLAIPFWVFLGLRMPLRLKLALLGVFFLGFIVTIVSCVRLYFLIRFFNMRYLGEKNQDPPYTLGWTTSIIECNLAIIAASIPTLWPVLRRLFPVAFSHLDGTYRPVGRRNSPSKERVPVVESVSNRIYGSDDSSFVMKPIHGLAHTEIRSQTPDGTQEELSAYNGIMRTTKVDVAYDDGPILPPRTYHMSVKGGMAVIRSSPREPR